MRPSIFFDFAGTLVKMRPARLLVRRQLLITLSQKFRLGIITGARRSETQNILRKLNIQFLFQSVVTADSCTYRKPDSRLFPCLPVAYIGDGAKDQLLAKNARVTFYRAAKNFSINKIIQLLLK